MPSVAVIIPVYNRPDYLRTALDSVLGQTRLPDEIFVVDDGSTDNTPAVAESYPGVTLLRQQNAGASAARNRGIYAATADWIAFLDSDDAWEPEKLALQLQAAERNASIDVCTCNWKALVVPGAPAPPDQPSNLASSLNLEKELFRHLRLPPGTILVRRTCLLEANAFDLTAPPCEDWDLWLRLAAAGRRFHLVPQALLLIRTHGSNISNQSFRMMDAEMRAWEKNIAPRSPALLRPWHRRAARAHFMAGAALVEREAGRPHLALLGKSLLLAPFGNWRRHLIYLHALLVRLGLLTRKAVRHA